MVRKDKSEYIIQAVSHALDLLEQFHDDVDELGVTELSKRLKLHKIMFFDCSQHWNHVVILNRTKQRKTIALALKLWSLDKLLSNRWVCCGRLNQSLSRL